MTYCNGETSVIRPDLTSPGAYLILFVGESLVSQPSGEVHTPVWPQTFMSPVGHSAPQYEGSPMEADSFWRCTGNAGVRPSVESGKDTKAKELMESGRTRGKSGHGNPGLSSATVRSLHLMLHNALNRAVKERLILRNPTEDCIAPKVQKFEMQILQPEHIKTYLDAAEKRGLLPMFYLELVSGLRKGELTAFLWSDLDITNRTISVSKQYVKNPNGELTLSHPKTETSVRKVSVPQEAVDLLVAEHKRHPNNPYMFPSPITREMYHPDSIVNLHKKILKDAGLPHMRFHDLRHPYVKHTTKIFSLRLMDFQAQAYPDTRRKTRGACQLLRVGQSRSPVRPLCNRKRFSCLPPQSKMSWILYAISMRLSGYTSTRSISSSASSVVSVSASKIALDASFRLSCRACSSCFCFACANTAA